MLMLSTAARDYRTQSTSWSLPRFLLRKWLRDRWALLFSHPDDFANYGFESDRWVDQVKEAFEADSVAALGISTRAPGDHAGWITAVGGSLISHRTFESILDHGGGSECASTYRNSARRFVMVLDGALQIRRTFLYSGAARVPSPIGLAAWARARLGRDPHS
jgi:alkyl hydroperoxide reductase subunit AhpC